METLFAQRVRDRMKEIGLEQQKVLAAALADATGDATTTCPGKLSKLFNGEAEGRAWIEGRGQRAERLPALASIIQVDEAVVRAWLDESDQRWELVLDPRLPTQAQSYLRERADGVRCVVADGPAARLDPKEIDVWIRDEAKKLRRPLVVLHEGHESRSAAFFAGAELRTTTVQQHPRGWILRAEPDLVRVPDPPPPKLIDDKGRLLVPCGALTAGHQRERGDTPTFPLAEALPHIVRARVQRPDELLYEGPLRRRPGWDGGAHAWAGAAALDVERQRPHTELVDPWKKKKHDSTSSPTRVWARGDRFFAIGPEADALRGLFAPHHPDAGCHVFELPDWIESERTGRNPWRREGEWWERVAATLEDDFGVSPDAFAAFARDDAMRATDDEERSRLLLGAEHGAARDQILALATRPVTGSHHLPLWLLALSEAPLLELRRAQAEALHVLGDVGAGRLLELRVFRFEGEAATPLRLEEGWFDGGDVRLQLTPRYDASLEGSARPARARRNDHHDDDHYFDDND